VQSFKPIPGPGEKHRGLSGCCPASQDCYVCLNCGKKEALEEESRTAHAYLNPLAIDAYMDA